MNNIMYHTLIASSILEQSEFPDKLVEWIDHAFKKEERGFFIAYCVMRSLSRYDSAVPEELLAYLEKLLSLFCEEREKDFLSLLLYSYIYSLYAASQSDLEITEASLRNWEKLIRMEDRSEPYSDLDYFGDLAKIHYLRSCYPVIAEHTKEMREVALELMETKEDFEVFDNKFKAMIRI